MKLLLAALVFVFALVACGSKEPEPVSFNTLEQERGTARANALFNGKDWRSKSPQYATWDLVGRGDSTQTAQCPVGDGWATLDLVAPDKKNTVQLKCSTVSSNVGCLEANDFKTKSYAKEDNACQMGKLPSPLPKIAE